MTQEERPNVVLTLLIDISGSMGSSYSNETRSDLRSLMDVTKHGLTHLESSLKDGDVINLVTFATTAIVRLSEWQYNGEDSKYSDTVKALRQTGSTNLNAGIQKAYEIAHQSYDPQKSNRVIMFTDANANQGQVNPKVIAEATVMGGQEGVHFAGVGIGSKFNESFLNELTDIGKGVYSAMITPEDAERIVTDGFSRFIDSAVTDVRFKLTYPQSLDQFQTASEEISTEASEVQTINFAYNSDQFFVEIFKGEPNLEEELTFTAYFLDDEGDRDSVSVTATVGELLGLGEDQIKSGLLVTRLAKLVGDELNCSEIQESALYMNDVTTDVFETYKMAIDSLCAYKKGPPVKKPPVECQPPFVTLPTSSSSSSSGATSRPVSSSSSSSSGLISPLPICTF